MNKKKVITISGLPVMWLIYFVFEFITGRIKTSYDIFMSFILTIIFAMIGYIIYKSWNKYKNGLNSKKLFLIFILLMLIDQGIKLIINQFFFNKNFDIIHNYLSFNPIINTDGSWINARFNFGINFDFLIIVNFLALFIFIECYRYYLYTRHKDFFSDICFIFITSGALCSLIDKLFYGGSLDFIGISNLFIADIKDIYINLAIFFFVLTIYFNGYWKDDSNTTLKDDINSIKKFLLFIKNDIKKNIFRKN